MKSGQQGPWRRLEPPRLGPPQGPVLASGRACTKAAAFSLGLATGCQGPDWPQVWPQRVDRL